MFFLRLHNKSAMGFGYILYFYSMVCYADISYMSSLHYTTRVEPAPQRRRAWGRQGRGKYFQEAPFCE